MTENNFYNHSKDYNSLKSEIYPVIRSICTVGDGSIENPRRRVYRYYALDGEFIGETPVQTTIVKKAQPTETPIKTKTNTDGTENEVQFRSNSVLNIILKIPAISDEEIKNAVKLADGIQKEHSCNCTLFAGANL